MVKKIEKIMNSKKLSNIKDLYSLVMYLSSEDYSKEQIIEKILEFDVNISIKTIDIEDIVDIILKRQNNLPNQNSMSGMVLYKKEIEFLKKINNYTTRKLMYAFIMYSKINPHPSGWIKYDKDIVYNLVDIDQAKNKEVVSDCCKNGLDLRVIGSKNPITCFCVNVPAGDDSVVWEFKSGENILEIYDLVVK